MWKRNKKYRLYYICKRLLACIHAKIRIATSCSIRSIDYTFRTLNTHGCPMLSYKRYMKIQKYVTKQLTDDGFHVSNVSDLTNGSEWKIKIKW